MRAWLVLLVVFVPLASGQSTTTTQTSPSTTTHIDPTMGSASDLDVHVVNAHAAQFTWTWSKGCSDEIALVLFRELANGTSEKAVQDNATAVDGPMEAYVEGLTAGTNYTAYIAPLHHCGIAGGSNTIQFTTAKPARTSDAPALPVALLLGMLLTVARRRAH